MAYADTAPDGDVQGLHYCGDSCPSFPFLLWALYAQLTGTSSVPFQSFPPKTVLVCILIFILMAAISKLLNKFPQENLCGNNTREMQRDIVYMSVNIFIYSKAKL